MQHKTAALLEDIRDAAQFIFADTEGVTFDAFVDDRRTHQLVERNFEIIGETMNRLRRHDPTVASRISASGQIIGLRNVLIHGYDVIDYGRLWRAVHEFLPILAAEVDELLREIGEHRGNSPAPKS